MTLTEQLTCARRELRLRQRVYPRWVREKKMKQSMATYEIAAMEAICATLAGLLAVQPDQLPLFKEGAACP